ncbi:MAG: adenosylcobinamide amidohydrolase [Deltaproteobacteria bacterium]|nr:adenosylcobinamide amidohydrolase [Deltaproteobacteria bacterium]
MKKMKILGALLFLLAAAPFLMAAAPPMSITDDAGQKLELKTPPARVVSLSPSATEVLAALGAADNLAVRTYHDTHLPALAAKPVIGGAFTPQWDLIAEAGPDLVIVPPRLAGEARARLPGTPLLVWDDEAGLKEADLKIGWLGDIFQKPAEAEKIRANNRELMELTAQKTAGIPEGKRLRVMRLLQAEKGLLTPGENSFETELIAAAGGIAPKMGKAGPGAFVPVSLEDWKKFGPQAVYACGPGRAELMAYLEQPGWNEAEAVKNKSVHYFPCALTSRAAAHTGHFTAWLSSVLYSGHFADKSKLVRPEGLLGEKPVALDVPYVEKAAIVESRLFDFVHRTLLVSFKTPRLIVSTNAGQRRVEAVGNSFSPTPTWSIYHQFGYAESRANLFRFLGLKADSADILSTGADMNNLSIATAAFKDILVTALVTAGVEGNALRTAKDAGNYYEPGTINIIVLVSHALSPRAVTRALTTVTEAKTAALWDMDIRSVQSDNPATGTGTDDIIVVSGDQKPELEGSGGHTKLGELIAEAVYAGVQEALLKQNGKLPTRDVLERLAERGLSPQALFSGPGCRLCLGGEADFQADFERLLLTPRYRAFLEAAFSLSDAAGMGQLSETFSFNDWSLKVAAEIAGRPVEKIEDVINGPELPEILGAALNALGTGLKHRENGG